MSALGALLNARTVDAAAISRVLDAQTPAARLAGTLGLAGKALARLYDAVEGHRPIDLDDLVPPSLGAMNPVVHDGLNNLPAFRRFAKVMCRPHKVHGELWGYNRGPSVQTRAVGPGYFVAYPDRPGEVLIDYTRLPTAKPNGWPTIIPNSARLSRFVYHDMQDVLRGVSDHVTIGRAVKRGIARDNWFILCRIDRI